jgi:hypothetical protein
MTSFRGQANWVKITSPGGKLTSITDVPTDPKSKQAEELTYISLNIGVVLVGKASALHYAERRGAAGTT